MFKYLRLLGVWIAFWALSSAAFAGSAAVLTFTKAFGASTVAINGSTSLTFTLATGGSAELTGAFGFTDTLPAGLVVATPSGLSAATCPGVLAGGTITAVAGSGTISISGLNLAGSQSCTFSVNVTGTSLGVKNNSVTTTGANIQPVNPSTKTANASITVTAAAATPPLIPSLPAPPPVVGLMNQPTALDLSGGSGPTMVSCLMSAVKGMLGADAVYLGQGTNGVAKISQGGRIISFYPLAAISGGSPVGVTLSASNVIYVTTSCGTFTLAPALSSPSDLGNYLTGRGLVAQFDRMGVLNVTVGDQVYFVRPDYFSTPGAPGAPVGVAMGSDGLLRFTDSSGNVQVLRPVFWDVDGLVGQLGAAFGGSTVIQLDGTALFTTPVGVQSLMTADYILSSAPAANASKLFWQDGTNHYQYRSSVFVFPQGFTSQAR